MFISECATAFTYFFVNNSSVASISVAVTRPTTASFGDEDERKTSILNIETF